jgi:hypothetical protein
MASANVANANKPMLRITAPESAGPVDRTTIRAVGADLRGKGKERQSKGVGFGRRPFCCNIRLVHPEKVFVRIRS